MESETKAGQYYLINLLREQSDESLQHLTWYASNLLNLDTFTFKVGIINKMADDTNQVLLGVTRRMGRWG